MKASKCIVIFGAGPAGLSAALWLRHMGFEPCVLEATDRVGGLQNLNFLSNDWVLGQTGQTGPMLARRFAEHAASAGVAVRTGVHPVLLSGSAGAYRVDLDNGQKIDCGAVLIATGTRYRSEEVLATVAGIAGISPGRIAYGPYAFADLDALAGNRVLIVGGGDNAFENARLLAPSATMVHLVIRSRAQAQRELVATVTAEVAAGRCRVLLHSRVLAISESKAGVEVTVGTDGSAERIVIDRINVLAGYEPNTAFIDDVFPAELRAAMRFDARGYLTVDPAGRTGASGIYAAGDVCNPGFPSVVSAISLGALAARTIELDNAR